MMAETSGSVMYAAAYGVKADATYTLSGTTATVTGTSDDIAMKAAVDACALKGSKLILPPGMILLTGAATPNLRNCHLEGAGPMGGTLNSPGSHGTMFLITSTTVKPFTIGDHWGMRGVNFFWPNQITGLTVYPPLFSPVGAATDATTQWYLDHVVIVNAYDAIVTGGGAFFVTDSLIYPMRDAFRVGNIGDSFRVNGVHFTPGPWFTMTNYAAPYGNVRSTNVMFHTVSAPSGSVKDATNFAAHNIGAFGMGVGIKIDSTSVVGISEAQFALDGIGTVIDATSGGVWAGFANAPLRGVAGCADTCFKMGANSVLVLDGWVGGSQQSFVETSGSNIMLNNVLVTGVGDKNDGAEYYAVHATANTGGLNILVKDSVLEGKPSNIHVHGIRTDVASTRLAVQNTNFQYFNDAIDAQSAPTTIITGNFAAGTQGTETIVTASMATGGNPIVFAANSFDKPPQAVITSGFGTAPGIQGGFTGIIFPGGSAPVTSGSFRLPFQISNAGACTFSASLLVGVSASQSGVPATWNVLTSGDVHGAQLYYNCAGGAQQ